MSKLAGNDRWQPALLERLTDHEPDQCTESREFRAMSMRQLRESVLRDLAALLNATNLSSHDVSASYPLIERSVLNYGLPTLAGGTFSTLDIADITSAISKAIRYFEPRIAAHSLRVSSMPSNSRARQNVIAFLIEGDLFALPYPERLYVRTEVDLERREIFVSARDKGGLR